jgi:3-methylfumaryl-CoA hydratase
MTTVDIEYLRQWIGREQIIEDPLDLFPAKGMAALLDHDVAPGAEDPLPPAWHWLYFLDAARRSATGIDGHPQKGDFLPPIPLPRRMWAAGALQITQLLRLGLPASKRSSIRSIEYKSGKSGELAFVILDHELTQGGKLCIKEEQTLVYRAMPAERVPLPPGEPAVAEADWSSTFEPDPVVLFKFSALTFNGHRIHYDRDYATQKEFYPGLVVHGPLLVTLLLDLLLQRVSAGSLRGLRFRAVRPTFDLSPLQLCARRDGTLADLWTIDREGFIGMSAVATLGATS